MCYYVLSATFAYRAQREVFTIFGIFFFFSFACFLEIFSFGGVYKLVRHHEKAKKKPWQFRYYPKMVLFGWPGLCMICQLPPIRVGAVGQPVYGMRGAG